MPVLDDRSRSVEHLRAHLGIAQPQGPQPPRVTNHLHLRGVDAPLLKEFPPIACAVTGRRMRVTRLTLTDFRSYASASLEPGPGFVLLYGENGAGKTNLLEAVSMLTPGRGLRGAALSAMACV